MGTYAMMAGFVLGGQPRSGRDDMLINLIRCTYSRSPDDLEQDLEVSGTLTA
jgi:hypothetical protein